MYNPSWCESFRQPIEEYNIKLGIRLPIFNKTLAAICYTNNKCGCTWIDTSFFGFEPCSGDKCNCVNEPELNAVFFAELSRNDFK